MDTQRKAVPTEYAGVRFRSKSEACFAMYLDHHKCQWQYEPAKLTLECGYVPDFLIIRLNHWSVTGEPFFSASLIEYKPSKPTQTYIENLDPKLSILCHHVGIQCHWEICHGSFFQDGDVGTVFQCGYTDDHWFGSQDGTTEWPLRQQISQHRFDLVSELSAWKGHL